MVKLCLAHTYSVVVETCKWSRLADSGQQVVGDKSTFAMLH